MSTEMQRIDTDGDGYYLVGPPGTTAEFHKGGERVASWSLPPLCGASGRRAPGALRQASKKAASAAKRRERAA